MLLTEAAWTSSRSRQDKSQPSSTGTSQNARLFLKVHCVLHCGMNATQAHMVAAKSQDPSEALLHLPHWMVLNDGKAAVLHYVTAYLKQ